jgi:outer membrane protein OmpA-like peptidoglycan-associated protein
MIANRGRKTYSRRDGRFSGIMFSGAVLLLVVLLMTGGRHMAGATVDTSAPTDKTDLTEPSIDIVSSQKIDDLTSELAELQAALDAAGAELEALKDSADIPAEVLDKLRKDTQAQANPDTIYLAIIDALAQQGISCSINDDTNSLRFDDRILFASGSTALSAEDETFLLTVYPVILEAISRSGQSERIERLAFAGYADDGGTLSMNIELSQNRAEAVLNYLLANNLLQLQASEDSGLVYAVSGMANQHPILENGLVNKDLSRRVEITIVMDNSNISDVVFGNE